MDTWKSLYHERPPPTTYQPLLGSELLGLFENLISWFLINPSVEVNFFQKKEIICPLDGREMHTLPL
jgi:hypothetical protein